MKRLLIVKHSLIYPSPRVILAGVADERRCTCELRRVALPVCAVCNNIQASMRVQNGIIVPKIVSQHGQRSKEVVRPTRGAMLPPLSLECYKCQLT